MSNSETDLPADYDWLPWNDLQGDRAAIREVLRSLQERDLPRERQTALDVLSSVVMMYAPHNLEGNRVGFRPENMFETVEPTALAELAASSSSIPSDWLRAHILHVAWECRRACTHLEVAEGVDAYLRHAEAVFDPANWVPAAKAIELAVRFGASLGRESESHRKALALAERTLRRLDAVDPSYFSARLLELLLLFGGTDPAEMARWARRCAEALPGDLDRTVAYTRIEARFWGSIGDEDAVTDAVRRVARALEMKAASAAPLVKPSFLKEALAAYRELPDGEADADRLMVEIQSASAESVKHMAQIEADPIDLSNAMQEARTRVSGHALVDALIQLSLIHSPADEANVRQRVTEMQKETPLTTFLPIVRLADDGRVVVPAAGAEDKPSASDLHSDVAMHQSVIVQAAILPATSVIRREHGPRLSDFISMCHASPFVPPNRNYVFARGLLAGIYEDFETSAYLLVPHLENAIRTRLEAYGAVTTSVRSNGVQMHKTLQQLLEMPLTDEIFGDARRLDLESLLTAQAGSNLRNALSHGLLTDGTKVSFVYAWWTTLCLVLLPLVSDPRDLLDSPTHEESGGN